MGDCYNYVKNNCKGGNIMRKSYLDNIRWITVVIVVVYHVIYMYNGIQTAGVIGPFRDVQYQDIYQYLVYPWFMLLLFVVSGMCTRFYLAGHTDREFLRARTRKLLVPSTIGLFVFQWILGYYNMEISHAWDSMPDTMPLFVRYLIMSVSGTGVLWYIQLLWLFSVLLVLIRKLEKDRLYVRCGKANVPVLLLLTIAIYGSAQVFNLPIIVVYRFGIYGLGFLIGYFILSHDAVMERLTGWWLPLSAAACALGILFVVCYFGQPYAEHSVLDTPLCNLFAWIAVLAILAFMGKWGNFKNAFSQWMRQKSWGLYVFHYMTLAVCAYYLRVYVPGMPAMVCYFLTGIAAFAGGILLYEIISRIPVLRWCVLGIRKTKGRHTDV